MLDNEKKILFLLLFSLCTSSTSNALANRKICEIKFDLKEVDLAKTERLLDIKYNSKYSQDQYNFDCYQIGLEHDKHRDPIANKPIFACCQTI